MALAGVPVLVVLERAPSMLEGALSSPAGDRECIDAVPLPCCQLIC